MSKKGCIDANTPTLICPLVGATDNHQQTGSTYTHIAAWPTGDCLGLTTGATDRKQVLATL
jgi:hypothetical protein